jgi:hypothetical protein
MNPEPRGGRMKESPELERDAPWWAPESGLPIGGREPVLEAEKHDRGPPDTPPPEASGEDF